MTTTDWLILLLAAGLAVVAMGAVYEADLAHRRQRKAEDEAYTAKIKNEELVAACTCHAAFHDLGVHAPGVVVPMQREGR